MNTKIIALLNEKGGVGKSSSAAAIAYLLAKQGKKAALIDFDESVNRFVFEGEGSGERAKD